MSADPTVKLHAPVLGDPAPEAHAVETPAARRRLITLRDLFGMLSVSKATGHRLLACGRIGPAPIRLTKSVVRFDADEVDLWFKHRKPDGNLYDAKSWVHVWESIKRRK